MKKRYFLSFNLPQGLSAPERERILSLAQPLKSLLGERYVATHIEGDSPRLSALLEVLRSMSITWFQREDLIFTRRELMAAELLNVGARGAPQGMGGASRGTVFDMSTGCPACGTGSTQVSALIMRPSEIRTRRRRIVTTLSSDVLFESALAQDLMREKVSGAEFRQVVSSRTGEGLGWHQLLVSQSMPPFNEIATRGVIYDELAPPCSVCRRDGHFGDTNEGLVLVYDRSTIRPEDLPDFVQTYEHFGCSRLDSDPTASSFAHPLLLMRPHLLAFLWKQGVRNLEAAPVVFLD